MINFFDNDMREIWASRDSGSTFPISRVYFENIQVWPEGEPPTPTGYTFSVSPTALTTDDSAKTVYFIITTNSPQWIVTPSQSWITVNGITGGTLEVSIAANSGTTDRQGALTFSYRKSSTGGTGYVTVDVVQEGAVPVFNYNVQYTSTDKAIVTPYASKPFGGASVASSVSIVSNTYYPDDDYGEIVADGDIVVFNNNAFRECTTLSSIVIPDTTTWLGNYAFYGCTNLSSIILPSGLTMICDYIFQNCTSLTSIVIPDTADFLNGSSTFRGCTSLSSVTFGSSVTNIGNSMFRGCTSLPSITISGGSIILISNSAFRDCTALSSVTISDTVKTISYYAFQGCTSLSTINYGGTMAQWGSVTKQTGWNNGVPATVVHCTDGDAPI